MALSHMLLVCLLVVSTSDGWLKKKKSRIPVYSDLYPDGAWIGTQGLFCVSSSKRSITRRSLMPWHSIVFFRGKVFEWGAKDFHIGRAAKNTRCKIHWEKSPATRSKCPVEVAEEFTHKYRSKHGSYHVKDNNCHLFADRLISRLSLKC